MNNNDEEFNIPKINGVYRSSPVALRSRILRYENGVVYILRVNARSDECGDFKIDLCDFYLPQTNLSNECSIAQDVVALSVMLLVLDKYLCSISYAVNYHRTAANWAAVIAKLFEFCRVCQVYSPKQLSPDHFRDLAEKIATGGWANALNLAQRCETLLLRKMDPSTVHGKELRLSQKFRRELRTCCSGRELSPIRGQVAEKLFGIKLERVEKFDRYTDSLLRQIFTTINHLAAINDDFAISFVPYPDVVRLSKRLGRETASTENLKIEVAAPLLTHSMEWVYKKGSRVIDLVGEVYKRGSIFAELHEEIGEIRSQGAALGLLAELCEVPVLKLQANSLLTVREFNRVVRSLVTACFIVIAVMNARRKNEVMHRRYGVYDGCLSVESSELQVYRCRFYIEKSLKDYDEFYVNKSTFVAIEVLISLQKLVWKSIKFRQSEDVTENTLFRFPRMMRGGELKGNDWFLFDGNRSHTIDYVNRALNIDGGVRITPHIFRRFYAVIFIYRFEDGGLQALSQDLGHFDMEMTRQYVLDTINTPSSKRIPPDFQVRMRSRERSRDDIELAIQSVGREKLQSVIDGVLRGQAYSGGFERLVRRMHNRLSANVDYRVSTVADQATQLSGTLVERGHEPRPFVHGDCMAGSVSKRGLARCRSELTKELDHTRARPNICRDCAYHHVSKGYLKSLASLIEDIRGEIEGIGEKSMRAVTLKKDLEQAEAALIYHRRKIEPH